MRKDKDMNRSEELCKLLGLTRRYCTKCGNRGYLGKEQEDIFECCMCHNDSYIIDTNKEIDLTKPSNFVKLLDLLNAYLDIRCDCLMAVVPQIISKAIFLASTNSSRFIEKKDKFKKQAQATKWDY